MQSGRKGYALAYRAYTAGADPGGGNAGPIPPPPPSHSKVRTGVGINY